MPIDKLCVLADQTQYFERAQKLSLELKAVCLDEPFKIDQWKNEAKRLSELLHAFDYALVVAEGLHFLPLKKNFSPLYINFGSEAWRRRLFNISSKTELAAKALGVKRNEGIKSVFDANAGLGQDSFVFAALGLQVRACERSPLVYLLLADALERASLDDSLKPIAERISLFNGESAQAILQNIISESESIFLDPMFPDKKHQAAAKREMQIFQNVLGPDLDASHLFEVALAAVHSDGLAKRLVIKRPKSSAVLKPEYLGHQVQGKATRFDVYFKAH